jgi:hypothetical protein
LHCSPAFDSFFATGMANTDAGARNAAFHSADYQAVITDAVVIPIYFDSMTPILKRPIVNDLAFNSAGGYHFAALNNVWLDLKWLYLLMAQKRP